MSAVDLARLQFATTSIYHFLFVPLTIGLAFLTAILQTLWYRKGHPEHLRLTRFFGTLLVITTATLADHPGSGRLFTARVGTRGLVGGRKP